MTSHFAGYFSVSLECLSTLLKSPWKKLKLTFNGQSTNKQRSTGISVLFKPSLRNLTLSFRHTVVIRSYHSHLAVISAISVSSQSHLTVISEQSHCHLRAISQSPCCHLRAISQSSRCPLILISQKSGPI